MEQTKHFPKQNYAFILKAKTKSLEKDRTNAKIESIGKFRADLNKNKILLKERKQMKREFGTIIMSVNKDRLKDFEKYLEDEMAEVFNYSSFLDDTENELSKLDLRAKRIKLLERDKELHKKIVIFVEKRDEMKSKMEDFLDEMKKSEKDEYGEKFIKYWQSFRDAICNLKSSFKTYYDKTMKEVEEGIINQLENEIDAVNLNTSETNDIELGASGGNEKIESEQTETKNDSGTTKEHNEPKVETDDKRQTNESKIKNLENIRKELKEITEDNSDPFNYNAISEAFVLMNKIDNKILNYENSKNNPQTNPETTEGNEAVQESVYFLFY